MKARTWRTWTEAWPRRLWTARPRTSRPGLAERNSLKAKRGSGAFLLLRLGANLFSISSRILRSRLAFRPCHGLGRGWLRDYGGRRGLSHRNWDRARRFRLGQRARHQGEQGKAGEDGHRESGGQAAARHAELRDRRAGRRRCGDGNRLGLRRLLDPFEGGDEAVAPPVHGLDDDGPGRVVVQRLADLADRLFDRAGGEVLDSPHPVQQLFLREDLRCLLRQHLQHPERVGAEADLSRRPRQPSSFLVENELSKSELHGLSSLFLRR